MLVFQQGDNCDYQKSGSAECTQSFICNHSITPLLGSFRPPCLRLLCCYCIITAIYLQYISFFLFYSILYSDYSDCFQYVIISIFSNQPVCSFRYRRDILNDLLLGDETCKIFLNTSCSDEKIPKRVLHE